MSMQWTAGTVKKKKKNLATVTGETLTVGEEKKRSVIETDHGRFQVEHSESERVGFNVMSAGQAANIGTWTIIGPDHQCLVRNSNAKDSKKVVKQTSTIPLVKKRGAYWLPAKPCMAGGSASRMNCAIPMQVHRRQGQQEESEVGRTPVSKKAPTEVTPEEYNDHMMTYDHSPPFS